MRRQKFVPKVFSDVETSPFEDAEEAWFWFVKCQRLRDLGANTGGVTDGLARPCEPDDLYRAVLFLKSQGRISRDHIGVLGRFGEQDRPPDPRCSDERRAAHLWEEALDRLTTVLRRKGIIRIPDVSEHPAGGSAVPSVERPTQPPTGPCEIVS